MANPLHLAVIVGSTRQGRFAPVVADWFAGVARRRPDMTIEVIDLADARLPDVLSAEAPPEVIAVAARLAKADAFVVITPEYNHSFPAPLKTAIDWTGRQWRAKPVGFVSYGGASGGLRAVEQLRQIFAELQAMTVRNGVSFAMPWEHFDVERGARAAAVMLDQLAWWGGALREARSKGPTEG